MTRPAEGTPCSECHSRGHFCAAQILVGHEALCLDCADDEPCLVLEAKRRTAKLQAPANPTVVVNGEEIFMSPHAVMGPELIDPFARQPMEGKTVTEKKRTGGHVSLEARKAIAEADPQIPHSELAKKLGISDVSVIKYRRLAGVFVPRKGGQKKKAGEDSGLRRVFKPAPKAEPLIGNEDGRAALITVPLEIDEEESIAIFRSLPAAEKASILGGVLRARLGL